MIGNIKSQKIIKDLFNRDNLSICLSGPEGVGKKTYALQTIGEILNSNTEEVAFHADLFFVESQNNIIKLDKIRELIKFSSLKSFSGGRKFAVIDDAHLMNIESQNALLKLIEEPPEGETIVLITSKYEELLPTIRSRVINVSFNKLSDDEMNQVFGRNLSQEILALANGSVSQAIKYLDYDMSDLSQFVRAFLLSDIFSYTNDIERDQFEIYQKYTVCVLKEMRRLVVGQESNLYDARMFQSQFNLSTEKIDRLLLKLDEAMSLYMGNFNKKNILTDLFIGNQ